MITFSPTCPSKTTYQVIETFFNNYARKVTIAQIPSPHHVFLYQGFACRGRCCAISGIVSESVTLGYLSCALNCIWLHSRNASCQVKGFSSLGINYEILISNMYSYFLFAAYMLFTFLFLNGLEMLTKEVICLCGYSHN